MDAYAKKRIRYAWLYALSLAAVFCLLLYAAPAEAAGSGTYTSPVRNFGSPINYDSFAWMATTPIGTSLTLRVRAGNTPDLSGLSWTTLLDSQNGGSLPALNGTQYFQYQADLSTTDDNAAPTLYDVSVNGTGSLISSAFDTTNPANAIGGLSWDEGTLPVGSAVTVSLRAAATAAGLTSVPWTDFTNGSPASCTKTAGTVTCSAAAIPAGMKDGAGDQLVQYKVTLVFGASAPTVTAVRVNYTAPFDFTVYPIPFGATVSPGQTTNMTLTARMTEGAAPSSVTWSAANLPTGVMVDFTSSPCTPTLSPLQDCTASVQVSTSVASCTPSATRFCPPSTGATPPNTYNITLSGSMTDAASETTVRQTTFALTVADPFDFCIEWTPTGGPCSGEVRTGTTAQNIPFSAAFAVTQVAGISSESVSFSANTGGVAGISVNFSVGSCFPTCSPDPTVTINTTGSTPVATHSIFITGTSATAGAKTIRINLTVTQGFSFSLAFDEISGTTVPGGTASPLPTLTTTWTSGTADNVSFTIDNPDPTHLTITPSPLSNCTFSGSPPQTCTQPPTPPFTVVASGSAGNAAPGVYPIRIIGTAIGSGQSQFTTYTLTVTGPFEFLMRFDPDVAPLARQSPNPQDTMSDTRDQGGSANQNISVTYDPAGPPTQTVSFSVTKTPNEPTITVPVPADCTTSCFFPMFINTADDTPTGDYVIRLTAMGGGVTHYIEHTLTVTAPPFDFNMRGWAWSQNIGWISFNSQNCDTNKSGFMDALDDATNPPASVACPQPRDGSVSIPNYGAHMDLSTYHLSGYAWSEMAGWITFDRTVAGTPPGGLAAIPTTQNCDGNASCMAVLNVTSGNIEGWARAISCRLGGNPVMSCDPANDWGWIKLSNPPANTYSAERDGAADFRGFTWGEHVFGWVSFSSKTCDTDGDGVMSPLDTNVPAGCPPNGTTIPSYKVWARGTLPNTPPVALNLTSNFLDRCQAPLSPTLNFKYRDAEGDPLAMYIINIYRASDNALVDGPLYMPGPAIADIFDIIPPAQYDPAPNETIDITYPYDGFGRLQYGVTYYYTVEVRDPAHLN